MESVKSQLRAAATERAISPVDPGGDALVTACRTVGQALGILVQAPRAWGAAGSTASADALGDLARASGFHVRPVTLDPDWWRRPGGEPLLARLPDQGNVPVALVPTTGRVPWGDVTYQMFDQAGRGRKVDERLAQRVDSRAWTIYRTLPDGPQLQARPGSLQPEAARAGASCGWCS